MLKRTDALWALDSGDAIAAGMSDPETGDGFSVEDSRCGNIRCWFGGAGRRHDPFLVLFSVDPWRRQPSLSDTAKFLLEASKWVWFSLERRWQQDRFLAKVDFTALDWMWAAKDPEDVMVSAMASKWNRLVTSDSGRVQVGSGLTVSATGWTSSWVEVATTTSPNTDWLPRTTWWRAGTQLPTVKAVV